MVIGLGFLIVLGALVYVTAPLRRLAALRSPAQPSATRAREMSDAAASREELQEKLSVIEFDRRMEKIDDRDYQDLRQGAAQRANLPANAMPGIEPSQRTATANDFFCHLDAEAEILIARARRRLARWQCGKCGRSMAVTDSFCASCGTAKP